MIQWLARAITVCFKSKAQLIAENLCLRQQLVILKRRVHGKLLIQAAMGV